MRPYPGLNLTNTKRILNNRLSRARKVIENDFRILTTRWRILKMTIEFNPENSENIVLACITLINFIILNDQYRWYDLENYVDRVEGDRIVHVGEWRNKGSLPYQNNIDIVIGGPYV